MIALIFAVLSSSLIFVIFKLFDRFKIDTFQAIVFNYFTAFSCGIILYGHEWQVSSIDTGNWPYYVLICSLLFISLFILMGWSSQRNGVALTSTAVKMSMAMSMLLMILLYNESISIIKVSGIILAFLGVFLVSFGKEESASEKGSHWMLLVLFIGSGVLDFVLNYVQKFEMGTLSASLFSAFGFGLAGLIGFGILLIQLLKRRTKIKGKNILAGVILGIPNYFSIFLLMTSYKATGWNDSTVLAINNVSIVIFSALVGFLAFKEPAGWRKLAGLTVSLLSITLLYLAGII
jgi:drug/metabolite transporter (DMT)-like permease